MWHHSCRHGVRGPVRARSSGGTDPAWAGGYPGGGAAAVLVRSFARPGSYGRQRGSWRRGLLVCAIDGAILTVPDTPANLTGFTRQAGNHGGTGYPQVRLLALVACGTRSLIDAVFGPLTCGENTYAADLLRSLRAGMIVLGDRNFAAGALAAQIARAQAEFLIRVRTGRGTPQAPRPAPPPRRLLPVTLWRRASTGTSLRGGDGSRRIWRRRDRAQAPVPPCGPVRRARLHRPAHGHLVGHNARHNLISPVGRLRIAEHLMPADVPRTSPGCGNNSLPGKTTSGPWTGMHSRRAPVTQRERGRGLPDRPTPC